MIIYIHDDISIELKRVKSLIYELTNLNELLVGQVQLCHQETWSYINVNE